MISLVMDTAGTACAACVYDSTRDTILAEISEEIGRGHAERLMAIISDVLSRAKIAYHDIDKIVTTIGPGSFTGIRVGVATARGFGLGLGIPVVGVSNLEAMMAQARQSGKIAAGDLIGVVMQAGRSQVYCCFSKDTVFERGNTPFLVSSDQLAEALNADTRSLTLCGNGVDEVAGLLVNAPMILEGVDRPSIGVIANIGSDRKAGDKPPEPLYIRKPDAKPQTGFAVGRSG